jgi:hypothetical protein
MDYCGSPALAGAAARHADHDRRNYAGDDDASNGTSGLTPYTAPSSSA